MIRQKLEILVDSNIITKETEGYVLNVLEYLLTEEVIVEKKQAEVFLTHLAMADARRQKKETIGVLDDFIIEEIVNDPQYAYSKKLWQELEKMAEDKFEEAELAYFYLHIINMLKED